MPYKDPIKRKEYAKEHGRKYKPAYRKREYVIELEKQYKARYLATKGGQESKRRIQARYRQSGKAKACEQRYEARKMNAPGNGITATRINEILESTMGHCCYCGQKRKMTLDHVVPLARGGGHDESNVVPVCAKCNSSKKDRTFIIWLYKKGREYGTVSCP
jgi:5-methylcytosine-specific restriction endonuclease McrA